MKKKTRKKKSALTGTLKGFSALVSIVAGAIYFYINPTALNTAFDKLNAGEQQQTETRVEAPASKEEVKKTDISSKLEIPVDLKGRKEIRIKRIGYTVSYNNEYKTPYWVAWELKRSETKGDEERMSKFMPDPDLPEPRADHNDYTNSGYDRGHMAPAADMKWSKQAMEESFYMSNICPQNQKLNRDDWGSLEDVCRKWARKYGTVYIACGPIYDKKRPKCIGKHKVAVPDRFFKVVLIYNRKNPIAMGFLFDNKPHHQALSKYMVSVDLVEEITGLDFFSRLPDSVENKIEAIVPEMPNY